ncbi:hypothetical protein EDD28_3428 [Salana multivorans]|uniref:Uncharacterized protein n=1 Tax=Salana multivorans TaxID=120377 RepID=A0A3N2D2L6_9MICO|nr:hypothetical protein [Salana multivorans]ROR93999.1 hypothetical protein EDD28_3428 [Salana multivorans]
MSTHDAASSDLPAGLLADLAAFRAVVAGEPDAGDGADAGAERPAVGAGHAFTDADEDGADGTVRTIRLTLADPRPLAAFEAELGAARRLPRQGPGRPVRWIFPDTLPSEGETGATVLAETDGDGGADAPLVARLLLRRD